MDDFLPSQGYSYFTVSKIGARKKHLFQGRITQSHRTGR